MRRVILFVAVAVVMAAMLLAMALPAFADDVEPVQPPIEPPPKVCIAPEAKGIPGDPPPQANNPRACDARGFILA
jgi:hypothetical protein